MNAAELAQEQLCRRKGAELEPSHPHLKVGISDTALTGGEPLNGLRHPAEGETTGWYIWAGQTHSDDPGFFKPLHVEHLAELCPSVLPYLGLPPGWRFLIADGYEDVWFDPVILAPTK